MNRPVGRLFRRLTNATAVLGFLAVGYAADDQAPPTSQPTVTSAEVQDLKRQLAEQQKQIEELRLILLGQKKQIETVSNASAAPAASPTVPAAPAPVVKEIGQIASATPMVPPAPAPAPAPFTPAATPAATPAPAQAAADATSPLTFHIGDASITPVGFMDLTNTFRSTNAGTSLQTNFGSIPYNNSLPTGRLSEDKLSAANSRIGFRVDAKVGSTNILGYYEGDFVGGVGDTAYNTQVSSNSLLYRIRLYWVDLRKDKFEFLAGQSWSMLTFWSSSLAIEVDSADGRVGTPPPPEPPKY